METFRKLIKHYKKSGKSQIITKEQMNCRHIPFTRLNT